VYSHRVSKRGPAGHDSEPTPTSIEDWCQRLIDKAVLLALAEGSFRSVQRIASKTLIPRSPVDGHLIRPLGMAMNHLPWVPQRTSPQQKGRRIQKFQELLAVLKSAKYNSWKNTITFGESFFYMHTEFEQMSLRRDEAPRTRERHMISSEKLVVMIAWKSYWFHRIEVLPKKHTFDPGYPYSSVLPKR
jgi:hypothetical protein